MAKQKSNKTDQNSKKNNEKEKPLTETQKTIARYFYNQGESEEEAIKLARKMA